MKVKYVGPQSQIYIPHHEIEFQVERDGVVDVPELIDVGLGDGHAQLECVCRRSSGHCRERSSGQL